LIRAPSPCPIAWLASFPAIGAKRTSLMSAERWPLPPGGELLGAVAPRNSDFVVLRAFDRVGGTDTIARTAKRSPRTAGLDPVQLDSAAAAGGKAARSNQTPRRETIHPAQRHGASHVRAAAPRTAIRPHTTPARPPNHPGATAVRLAPNAAGPGSHGGVPGTRPTAEDHVWSRAARWNRGARATRRTLSVATRCPTANGGPRARSREIRSCARSGTEKTHTTLDQRI